MLNCVNPLIRLAQSVYKNGHVSLNFFILFGFTECVICNKVNRLINLCERVFLQHCILAIFVYSCFNSTLMGW